MARAKGLSPCSTARVVDNSNTNLRGPTNHARNWNSNLRFDPRFFSSRQEAGNRHDWPALAAESRSRVELPWRRHGAAGVRRGAFAHPGPVLQVLRTADRCLVALF